MVIGQFIVNWIFGINMIVQGIVVIDMIVYVIGEFLNVNNIVCIGVVVLSVFIGVVFDFNFVFVGGYGVCLVVVLFDKFKVVIVGLFILINGLMNFGCGMVVFDVIIGVSFLWVINSVICNGGIGVFIYLFVFDGDSVYGSGYDFGGLKIEDDFEGLFCVNWSDGLMVWMEDCYGDIYLVYLIGGVLYIVVYLYYCGNIGEFLQFDLWNFNFLFVFDKNLLDCMFILDFYGYCSFIGNFVVCLLYWYLMWQLGMVFGMSQVVWLVIGGGDYFVYGGEFIVVSGVVQQGFVCFVKLNVVLNKVGLIIKGGVYLISMQFFCVGQVCVVWLVNYDVDNVWLMYEVFCCDVVQFVYMMIVDFIYWVCLCFIYLDIVVIVGQIYEYCVKVIDLNGNLIMLDWMLVKIVDVGMLNVYNEVILVLQLKYYWLLNEVFGMLVIDWVVGNDFVFVGGIICGQVGQVVGQILLFMVFNGSNGMLFSLVVEVGFNEFLVEVWFQIMSISGGKIVGFGNNVMGFFGSYDCYIYLSNIGQVMFGVYLGFVRIIISNVGFNDGNWYQVVVMMNGLGMVLYVDGVCIGICNDIMIGQSYFGYWRVGGDLQGGWLLVGLLNYFNGCIVDVVVYDFVFICDVVDVYWVVFGCMLLLFVVLVDVYGKFVYDFDLMFYWCLGEMSGMVVKDFGCDGSNGIYQISGFVSIQCNQVGVLFGVSNLVICFMLLKFFFSWNNCQMVVSVQQYVLLNIYLIEIWFKIILIGGGKLIGFGNSNFNNVNLSSNYDWYIYMDLFGQFKFGVYSGGMYVFIVLGIYWDGQWYYVVGQQLVSGMQFFVDGVQVVFNMLVIVDNYVGYWCVGGDMIWEGDLFWVGMIDEVVVYLQLLILSQVLQYFQLGKMGQLNQFLMVQFMLVLIDFFVVFDVLMLSDFEGLIVQYFWEFGDGYIGIGVILIYVYDVVGIYIVIFMVKDVGGFIFIVSYDVIVCDLNVLLMVVFMEIVQFFFVVFDGLISFDSDGMIVVYLWNFGDGVIVIGVMVIYVYVVLGIYEVLLMVIDDCGGFLIMMKLIVVEVQNVLFKVVVNVVCGVDGMLIVVDGSGFMDVDGIVVVYVWDFGDGVMVIGVMVNYIYVILGIYMVMLKVMDDDGVMYQMMVLVVVILVVIEDVIVRDVFEWIVFFVWGFVEVGGVWMMFGGVVVFLVVDGVGKILFVLVVMWEVCLLGVLSIKMIIFVMIVLSSVINGGVFNLMVNGCQVGNDVYFGCVKIEVNGVICFYLFCNEMVIGNSVVIFGIYVVGEKFLVLLGVQGILLIMFLLKVWWMGIMELVSLQLQVMDIIVVLQVVGLVGIKVVISLVLIVFLVILVDDYKVVIGVVVVLLNQVLIVVFVFMMNGFMVNVDGSGLSDLDGMIMGYVWMFGDGVMVLGVIVLYVYVVVGMYNVMLIVIDDDGVIYFVMNLVIVIVFVVMLLDFVGLMFFVIDEFDCVIIGGWGVVDFGGVWVLFGGNVVFSMVGGKGVVMFVLLYM